MQNQLQQNFDLTSLTQVLVDTDASQFPLAAAVEKNVLVYNASDIASNPGASAELYRAFSDGPGVVTIRNLMDDSAVIDRASAVFDQIIQAEKSLGQGSGDHFAKPGSNDRVWNSLEKHCLADPENFVAYFANPALKIVCEAWLGPAFQMTAQVNRVNPGGGAQSAHRDYHLGFMTNQQIRRYPPTVHALSPMLTLQGAIAHVDMPLESGPTMYLPHSHKWAEGYLYASRAEVQALFGDQMVQLPLAKGDAAFFNPAVLHGAGNNKTDHVYRLANLLQVSSAMGRPMETVNRQAMEAAALPHLRQTTLSPDQLEAVVAMIAEGYAFPNDLDKNPPIGGLAPPSQAQLLMAQLTGAA